jgi:hypothetical protein
MAGSNSFSLTPKRWIEATNAIGIVSKTGRYGGTFAHKDIAFEFATWLSAEFKFYLIREFQRLKEDENKLQNPHFRSKRKTRSPSNHKRTSEFLLRRRSGLAKRRPFRQNRQRMARRKPRLKRKYARLRNAGTVGRFVEYGKYKRLAYPSRTLAITTPYSVERNGNNSNAGAYE